MLPEHVVYGKYPLNYYIYLRLDSRARLNDFKAVYIQVNEACSSYIHVENPQAYYAALTVGTRSFDTNR